MKNTHVYLLLCASLAVTSLSLQAQGVFVTRGANGPVFSNKPQPGAKEMVLPPLTVIEIPQESKVPPLAAPAAAGQEGSDKLEAAASPYRNFSIVLPQGDGSVVASTAVFDIRLAVEPPLSLGEQHAFVVMLNGRPVEQRFTATEFMLPPEFWGDALPPDNQVVQLDANIVDGSGRVLKKAAPVRFVLHTMNFLRAHRPPRPPQPPSLPPPQESRPPPPMLAPLRPETKEMPVPRKIPAD